MSDLESMDHQDHIRGQKPEDLDYTFTEPVKQTRLYKVLVYSLLHVLS